MSSKIRLSIAVILSIAVLSVLPVQADETVKISVDPPIQDPGIAAVKAAAETGQFLMVLFQKTNESSPLVKAFETVGQSLSANVKSVVINTEKPEESGLVDNYNVRFAPLPMVVILAPNGAITGNFKKAFTQDQVEAMLLSPVSQQCLLAFQQRKIVFLCVQSKNTASNPEALDGVKRFRNEPKLKRISEVVMIDPTDPDEKKLLGQLRIASETAVAETFLLAPPGQVVNKWTGPTSKEAFNKALRTLMKAQQTCQIPDCGDPNCEIPKKSSPQGGVN